MPFKPQYNLNGEVLPPMLREPRGDAHKYDRGSVLCFSGPRHRTGAIRLSAKAALRMGAGVVTIVGEAAALDEHAAHCCSIMLREEAEWTPRVTAALIGPAAGVGEATRDTVLAILAQHVGTVLDADALTVFAEAPDDLFDALHDKVVLTPHAGEFARLFPDISLDDPAMAAREAADKAGCAVLLKGAVTQIADSSGRWAMNTHSSPWLATAGSGDVLAGMIAGLLAQGADAFDAAAMAAWMHGDIALRAGAGLTADDMEGILPIVFENLPRSKLDKTGEAVH
jgi:ADP-dependent NAD(P)H-hydrate dehydratase / NAD(P)H-hydrate epimerase